MIKLYNTLSREKEEFKPTKDKEVGIYACGPTVYFFAHIGNFRTYVFEDVLRRVLEFNGYAVKFVMNITDVGHLTDDADAGEDKMLLAMRREGKSAQEIAEFYTQAFMADVKKLNIKPADEYPRATDHIQEQIELIKKLEEKGFTYQTTDGVYFDTSKLPDYGRLSGQKSEEKEAGARVAMGEKKNPTDFALWKFSSESEQRLMEWESPWGKGFPGWHIECSAMSAKYLGIPFDIHLGGIDHVPVHHENEIAQTQAAEGKLLANYWVHSDFLTVDGGKMSKSLGNIYTISDLAAKGIDPLAFRYFCLGAHYRTKLNFTTESINAAQNALNNLRDAVRDWDSPSGGCAAYEQEFAAALDDDLNLPEALAVVWQMKDSASASSAKAASLLKFDQVLGLELDQYVAQPLAVPEDVKSLVKDRERAREEKDFERADQLREQIEKKGFTVDDQAAGSKINQKH
ncbi:cysteine--tRNA ligase [Patescibacteria group bacterium]|nr:cysteine--tRNA ligase [Patescibacteria group bacterium]MBU1705663.1 cysteine--tRNA ligase [Patescibacteria group bacterium]